MLSSYYIFVCSARYITGVPADIRAVPRPKNTIVEDNGHNGPKRYAVRARQSAGEYVKGGNPKPRNGKVIGHIVNHTFVPLAEASKTKPEMLSYGSSALVKSVTVDLYADLLKIWPVNEAMAIMAMAALKVIHPSITYGRMKTHYARTFVSRYYPGAPLSKNSICSLLQRIGQDGGKRKQFYELRIESVTAEHHIAIDGMLKQDSSTVNDLSAFSYKSRLRHYCELSLLYAYDIERMEPICSEVFPDNRPDMSSYADFIRDNDLRRGLIIDDRGFPPSQIEAELKERPDLHFLTPLKRNDQRIGNNAMLDFDGVLPWDQGEVLYKKHQMKGERYLYSFMNETNAATEKHSFLVKAHKKGFKAEQYTKKKDLFGVIVFESDLDLPPLTVYLAYQERWMLELVFRTYKSDECLDRTSVQGDFSVIGSEFINFIATIATCRIIRKAHLAGLLDHMTYGDLMEDLSSAWRRTDFPLDDVP